MTLKILMVVPKFPMPIIGGMEKQSLLLSNQLAKTGTNISVLSTEFSKTHKKFEILNGIKVYRIMTFNSQILSILYQFFYIPLFLIFSRNKFDIIHIHQHSSFGIYTLFISKLFRNRTILKLPNLGDKGLLGLSKSLFGSIKISILKWSDAIIAMTPEHRDELLSLNFSEKIICSIPNGVNINSKYNYITHDNNCIKFCYIGRLEKQKGILFLLECWSFVAKKYPNAKLEICGDGSLKGVIIDFIKKTNIENSVYLSGYSTNIENVLSRCDVFIITSETEGMSNAILEAMSFGKPIIASNVGAANIQFKDNFYYSTFDLKDKEKLIYLMEKNITDTRFRIRNSSINYNRSLIFDIKSIAEKYNELYLNIKFGNELNKANYDY